MVSSSSSTSNISESLDKGSSLMMDMFEMHWGFWGRGEVALTVDNVSNATIEVAVE